MLGFRRNDNSSSKFHHWHTCWLSTCCWNTAHFHAPVKGHFELTLFKVVNLDPKGEGKISIIDLMQFYKRWNLNTIIGEVNLVWILPFTTISQVNLMLWWQSVFKVKVKKVNHEEDLRRMGSISALTAALVCPPGFLAGGLGVPYPAKNQPILLPPPRLFFEIGAGPTPHLKYVLKN